MTGWEGQFTGNCARENFDNTTKWYIHKPNSVSRMRCRNFSGVYRCKKITYTGLK